MPTWRNWSGKLTAKPAGLHFVRSEADAQALAQRATAEGQRVRVAGATHSHAPLVQHDGLIVDSSGLSGVIETDPERKRAWIWAGTRIFALGRPLHDAGLALANQGDIDQQAIAGATATGTHGTGATLKNLSAAVTGMQIATAAGELIRLEGEALQAARLHLGAFGIVTRLQLQLVPAYRLQEQSWAATLDALLADTDQHIASNRHFEFFWYPRTDTAQAKTINPTDAPPQYPLAGEGERVGWNYEVLANHRPFRHTEMEYSVPAAQGPACMQAIARLLRDEFTDVQMPVEYRTLAADDVWLSTAYERDTVTISVHEDVRKDDAPYFRACEEIFLRHDGRPHWGKVHYLEGTALQACHPRWQDWWQARDDLDPQGTFLNPYLEQLRT